MNTNTNMLDVRVESDLGTFEAKLVNVHKADQCTGGCPIHGPSEHPLNKAPMVWRPEKHIFERKCDHGVRHPDPDSVDYLRRVMGDQTSHIHGCDGCCAPDSKD